MSLAALGRGAPIDKKESWVSMTPPSRTPPPPPAMSSPAAGNVLVGVVRELAHVRDPVAHPGPLEVGEEHLVIERRLVLEALDLLRAPVVAGVGIDGVDLDAGGGGQP